MSTAYVFICPGQNGITIANAPSGSLGGGGDSRLVPHCPSGGSWQLITYADPVAPFDPAQIDPAELGAAFAAGFIVVATGLLISWPIRLVIKAFNDW